MLKNGLVFYDNYCLYQRVSECAYYLWLSGFSDDSDANWLEAENFILGIDIM
jgi:hypothetical protein